MPLLNFVLSLTLQSNAVAINVSGSVRVEHQGQSQALVRFASVPEGATVATDGDGQAALRFASGSLVRLGPNTRMALDKVEQLNPAGHRKEKLSVFVGRIWARVMTLVGDDSHFEVQTKNAVAGVRGTAFWVESGENGDQYTVDHGSIDVQQGDQHLLLEGFGASTNTSGSGFGPAVILSAADVEKLRNGTGGGAASLLANLGEQSNLLNTMVRENLRQDLNGPNGLSDTDKTQGGNTTVPGQAGDVSIKVQVVLPEGQFPTTPNNNGVPPR